MKVALDAQLTVGTATGIGEYVRGLAEALRKRGVEVSVRALQPALLQGASRNLLPRLTIRKTPHFPRGFGDGVGMRSALDKPIPQ